MIKWTRENFLEAYSEGVRDFSRIDFSGVFLDDLNIPKINLSGANLVGARFNNSNLEDANLSGATCDKARFDKTVLYGADLRNVSLNLAIFDGATLLGVRGISCFVPYGIDTLHFVFYDAGYFRVWNDGFVETYDNYVKLGEKYFAQSKHLERHLAPFLGMLKSAKDSVMAQLEDDNE